MNILPLSRSAGWSLVALALVAAPSFARAQAPVQKLDTYVVSASRTPQDPRLTPSSVSLLPLAELQTAQTPDLRTALAETPGVAVVASGARGSQSSVFLRGANSDHTLFIVDGVRMNDRAAAYLNFLGGADLLGVDRLEVLRGPQSTVYGSSALGGVILMDTAHGCGKPAGALAVTAGSFDTLAGSASVQGGTKTLGFSASLGRYETANDRPGNVYRQWSYTTRVEGLLGAGLLVGATLRGQQGDYEEPGSRLYKAPGQVENDNHLATTYGQWRLGDSFTSRLTAAWHQRAYTYTSSYSVSPMRNTREVLDWQNTWAASSQLELVAGANAERSSYKIAERSLYGSANTSTDDTIRAAYVSATAKPAKSVVLTGGLRCDDYKTAGSATTGRAGVAWLPAAGTKLRATYGTGFNAPGSDDRFGVPQWSKLPNASLQPEKSHGWDAGIDQDIADGATTLSATYFHNRFTNLFEWQYVDYVTYSGRTVNRARASSEGFEFAATVRLGGGVQTRLSYTYIEAHNDQNGQRLIRRPRHTTDGEVRWAPAGGWVVGAGVHGVADRVETAGRSEDYTTARLFASCDVGSGLLLKVRVENALNEKYEEVLGYAALSRGVFGSVEWKF
ncbi:MAG: TonB-dependent receptor [Opitutae bacterium]|nr:TonB-dependent receptor [Opitutae bacterium]